MHEEQTKQRNKSLSIFQGSAFGSLSCDVQLKLWRSSTSHCPQPGPPLTASGFGTTNSPFTPNSSQRKKNTQISPPPLPPVQSSGAKPSYSKTNFTRMRRQNKIPDSLGSYSTAWVGIQTSHNIILNSALKIKNTAYAYSIFVTF